ncbi:MAG: hypothetical protein ACOZB3_02360 [Calditrichota bacterium]
MNDLDPQTIRQLEQEGALRKGWREHVDRRRRIRARFLELTKSGMEPMKAIRSVAMEYHRSEKLIQHIVYPLRSEDKMPSPPE